MLDENLPAFFLKPSTDGVAHHRAVFLSYHGSDPAPAYVVHHADPNSPTLTHKNCYAAALFDAYTPDVLFGEVLARPNWTQPTNSQEEIRRNGGVPRPPQPTLPSEFVVQLYNPDQQVTVELKEGKWGGSDSWHFSLPEEVFRQPSPSVLDHGQSDPASLATTPRINFVWRKESKLNKDLTCYMTGRSTDTKRKSARKDPDIAIGLWRSMRELTVYEPNLTRVDLEDPKGLEVVLILSAIVIKDLYFANKERIHEIFNISDAAVGRKGSGGGTSPPNLPQRTSPSNDQLRANLPKLQTTPPPRTSTSQQRPPPPLADPRAQWELDAETARLRAQAEAEARAAERRRREKDKADELERRRLQKIVEQEERAARARKAEVDRETARLRQIYGVTPIPRYNQHQHQQHQQQPQRQQQQTHHQQQYAGPLSSRQRQSAQFPVPATASRPKLGSNGLPLHSSSPGPSVSSTNLSVNTHAKPVKKKSFFGLRALGPDDAAPRLTKKSSSIW